MCSDRLRAARYREEAPFKIHGGCGLVGICNEDGARVSGELAMRAVAVLHDRGNGLGGGFAGYGIYPAFPDHIAFHLMYSGRAARDAAEEVLRRRFSIDQQETVPTRRMDAFRDAPEFVRYFARVSPAMLEEERCSEDDYVVRTVMFLNSKVDGAYVASSGHNMGTFKGVGYPEDIARFFRLEEYEGWTWTAHNRFPTNTPGWWGGAHPFALLDWSIVHNGELSSYGTNRRYLEQFGYDSVLGTDTEVVTYLFDLLSRRHGLPVELAARVLAAPRWTEIERLRATDPELAQVLERLRLAYAPAELAGPFALVLGFKGGMLAVNDRLKLRPLVVARKGARCMAASEEAAILAVMPDPDEVMTPRAGEPFVAHVAGCGEEER